LEEEGPVPYVSVEHEPGLWVDAHVEKQSRREGRWRLSVYYFVGTQQFYRVFDADQVRPVNSAACQDDEQRHASAGHEPSRDKHERREPIDLRDALHVGPLD
jgi:hypothetical protein